MQPCVRKRNRTFPRYNRSARQSVRPWTGIGPLTDVTIDVPGRGITLKKANAHPLSFRTQCNHAWRWPLECGSKAVTKAGNRRSMHGDAFHLIPTAVPPLRRIVRSYAKSGAWMGYADVSLYHAFRASHESLTSSPRARVITPPLRRNVGPVTKVVVSHCGRCRAPAWRSQAARSVSFADSPIQTTQSGLIGSARIAKKDVADVCGLTIKEFQLSALSPTSSIWPGRTTNAQRLHGHNYVSLWNWHRRH